ncbi:DUF560 domain-containing protein, partial [Pusillimonas sp. TS35]|nr:DUF560 domain-containing protein [Pusillimonas sp. TS35]
MSSSKGWVTASVSMLGHVMRVCMFLFVMAGAVAGLPAIAQLNDDVQRRAEQGVLRLEAGQIDALMGKGLANHSDEHGIAAEGQPYMLAHTAAALGRALYLALQHRQWPVATRLLSAYQGLADYDPMLLHYARGMLARAEGNSREAQAEFRAVLVQAPDFLPARLELARALFDDAQDIEAARAFAGVLALIGGTDARTAGVRRSVDAYLAAIGQRRAWGGALSMGARWSDNVNRTSASRTCLVPGGGGLCMIERTLPGPVKAVGGDYEVNVRRRMPLYGHHGVYVRAGALGTRFRAYRSHDDASLAVLAGYSYRDARFQLILAPTFEQYRWGGRLLYNAWGVHAEGNYLLGPRASLKFDVGYKSMHYHSRDYAGVNRTGNRGGCWVKVKQVPQPVLQVVDSIALRLRPAGYHRSSP